LDRGGRRWTGFPHRPSRASPVFAGVGDIPRHGICRVPDQSRSPWSTVAGSKAGLGLSASVYNTFSTFLVGTNVLTARQCNCLISCAFVVLRDTKPNSRIVWEGRQLSRPPKAAQPPSCPFGSEWVVMDQDRFASPLKPMSPEVLSPLTTLRSPELIFLCWTGHSLMRATIE